MTAQELRIIAKTEFEKCINPFISPLAWHWWKRAYDNCYNVIFNKNKKNMKTSEQQSKEAKEWIDKNYPLSPFKAQLELVYIAGMNNFVQNEWTKDDCTELPGTSNTIYRNQKGHDEYKQRLKS